MEEIRQFLYRLKSVGVSLPKRMRLSVIIPVYNEVKTIEEIIKQIKNVRLKNIKKEIILVDDFSTDMTREKLKKVKGKNIKLFFHKMNFGKGMAVRTGIKHSRGDIIIIQDADLEYDPNDYPKLIEPIIEKKTNVVYGSRFLKKPTPRYKLYYIGNILLSILTNILYDTKITDMETCYKVFTKDVIKNIKLKAKRFDFEPEITAKIAKKGYEIYEVPIKYQSRSFKQGKKITWRDGIKAIYYLLKYRFVD